MKRLLIFAAATALVIARPETYKEQEDFQYSRSSSDDGTKSGYYGAQRGNMGGNYERAHNMDGLAQNQMSGLVRQVEGEIGDGVKTRTGSVYSAANSRGTYGSGHYDLSNLAGRNFQEGTYSDNSQSRSALTQSSSSQSQHYGGYQRTASDVHRQAEDLQSLSNSHRNNQYNYGSSGHRTVYASQGGFQQRSQYDRDSSSSHNADYASQGGFQERSQYDRDNANLQTGPTSVIYTRVTPVRVVVRPGGRVAIPVNAQLYDSTSSVFNQNALDSNAELTNNNNNQATVSGPGNTRFYESSYRYKKKWEKHDTIPTSVSITSPTESSIPRNSELYEDRDVSTSNSQYNSRAADSQTTQFSSASNRYNAANSVNGQSRYRSNYNSQSRGDSNSNTNGFAQTGFNGHIDQGVSSDSSNAYTHSQHNAESRYHGAFADSRLSTHAGHNTGSNLDLNSQVEDLNTQPKSYQSSYSYHKSWERQGDPYVIKPASTGIYDGQSSQRLTSSTKNLRYTTYQSRLQHGQDQVDCDENGHTRVARSYATDSQDMGQQSQQVQDNWQGVEHWNQQSQSDWDQQNVGQQSQNQWENLETLSQQSQSNWDQQNVRHQSQGQFDNLETFNQESQSNLDQQTDLQQSEGQFDNLETLSQQSQSNLDQLNVGQQSQSHWDTLEDLNQQSQSNLDPQNLGQQSQSTWDTLEDLNQKSQSNVDQLNVGQQSQSHWDTLENLNQQQQSNFNQQNVGQLSQGWENLDQQNIEQNQHVESETLAQQTQNFRETQSKNEDKNEPGQFYWHHTSIPNGADIDQSHHNTPKQELLSQKDYSNNSSYEDINTASGRDYGIRQWNSNTDSNSHVQGNWQEYATIADKHSQVNNYHSNSHSTPLANLWAKFDNIDQSNLFTNMNHTTNFSTFNLRQNHTYSVETSLNRSDISQSILKPISVYQTLPAFREDMVGNFNKSKVSQSNRKNNTADSREYQKPSRNDFQPVSDKIIPEDQPETSLDKGRGDISAEDLSSSSDSIDPLSKNPKDTIQTTIHNEMQMINESSNDQLNVLGLQHQIQTKKENIDKSNERLRNDSRYEHAYSETGLEPLNYNQNHTNNVQENILQMQNQNIPIDQENINLEQQNVHSFGQQYLQDFIQHDKTPEQNNFHIFGQENVLQNEQQNKDLEQSNLHNYFQQNDNDFADQVINQGQQNLFNFNHETALDGVQQNRELEQINLHDFIQVNKHNVNEEQINLNHRQENNLDFNDQNENKAYNIQNFQQEIKNLNHFEEQNNQFNSEQNKSIDQHYLPHIQNNVGTEQQHKSVDQLTQKNDIIENYEHQFVNPVEQETDIEFGQHNEQFISQNLNLFQQENIQDRGEYEEQLIGQNLNSFQQENIHDVGQYEDFTGQHFKLPQQENIQDREFNWEKPLIVPHTQQIEKQNEHVIMATQETIISPSAATQTTAPTTEQKQFSQSQHVLNNTETKQPGFWKSVHNKIINAKDKVASWFGSI